MRGASSIDKCLRMNRNMLDWQTQGYEDQLRSSRYSQSEDNSNLGSLHPPSNLVKVNLLACNQSLLEVCTNLNSFDGVT